MVELTVNDRPAALVERPAARRRPQIQSIWCFDKYDASVQPRACANTDRGRSTGARWFQVGSDCALFAL